MGIYQRKYGMPVYVTAPTLAAAPPSTARPARRCTVFPLRRIAAAGRCDDRDHSDATRRRRRRRFRGRRRPMPLGGADRSRARFLRSGGRTASLDAVLLESNYDPQMLASGPYPGVPAGTHPGSGWAFVEPRVCPTAAARLSEPPAMGLFRPSFRAQQRSDAGSGDPPGGAWPGVCFAVGEPLRRARRCSKSSRQNRTIDMAIRRA